MNVTNNRARAAARVGEPAGLARARDRSRNHGRNLAQIGSLGTYSLGTYTEGKGSGHGKVSRCGAGRRAGHRWCGLCHVLRRMRRLSRAGWSWWLRADAGLLCWWAAERGARYGTSGITLTGPGAVLAVPSSRRRSGWRGYSDTTGPTTRQPWPRHRGKRSGSERRRQCHTGSHDHGDNLRLRSSGTTVSLPRRRASSSSGQLAFASLTRTRVPRPARHASGRREASGLRPQTLLVLVCSRPGPVHEPRPDRSLTKRTSIMARIALGLLSLALLLGVSGCTWTETYRDYPPGVRTPDDHQNHHHPDVVTE